MTATREPATPRSCATFRSLWKPLGVFIFGLLFYSQELVQAQLEQAQYTFEEIVITDYVPGATAASANGNSTHEIAGDYDDKDGVTHGFVLSKGVFTTVDFPGATFTQINGINAPGRFAGTYSDTPLAPDGTLENARGYFSSKGDFVTIHPPQSSRTQVGFLNAQGEVVGAFRDNTASPPFKRRSFIWKDGHFTTYLMCREMIPLRAGRLPLGLTTRARLWGTTWIQRGLNQRILSKQKRRVHEIRGPGRASNHRRRNQQQRHDRRCLRG